MIGLATLYKEKKIIMAEHETEVGNPDDIYKYLRTAIEIMEFCVGVDHPETAELYTKLALAYKDRAQVVSSKLFPLSQLA